MFRIRMLPATFGDSFWVTYQKPRQKQRHILIDGGTAGTRQHIRDLIEGLPARNRHFELVVVSHIDNDHIAGILTLLQKNQLNATIGDFWFNGRKHLPNDLLGAGQGEQLTQAIEDHQLPWNAAFGGNAVVVPDHGPLPVVKLKGGMKLTLLSPAMAALAELAQVWDAELRRAGLLLTDPLLADQPELQPFDDDGSDFLSAQLPNVGQLAESAFRGDQSEANGSSIAFLLEFDGRRALFTADAHAGQMLNALTRLSPGTRFPVDFFKISHHGSQGTTNRALIEKVICSKFAITTNGSNFRHPDRETVARILTSAGNPMQLLFNYRSAHNGVWDHAQLKADFDYSTSYPEAGAEGLVVDL